MGPFRCLWRLPVGWVSPRPRQYHGAPGPCPHHQMPVELPGEVPRVLRQRHRAQPQGLSLQLSTELGTVPATGKGGNFTRTYTLLVSRPFCLFQSFREEDCSCQCKNRKERLLCQANVHKTWDDDACTCSCLPKSFEICQEGQVFDFVGTCR